MVQIRAGAAMVLVLLAPIAGCKKEPRDPAPVPEVSVVAVSPPPPSVPIAVPPVATFELSPGGPSGGSTTAPTATVTPSQADPSGRKGESALDKARLAALEGRAGEVRSLLGGKVRAGHGSIEEARLVKGACRALGDMACLEDIKAKYP